MSISRVKPSLHIPNKFEPVTHLRRIPIRECGEELVDFLQFCPALVLDRPRFDYHRLTLLRRSVAERLCRAANSLPEGYKLAVIEGWRAPHIQRAMYEAIWGRTAAEHPDWSHTKLTRIVNRYSAPMNPRVPPPHTTGGAVDLLLADSSGKPLDHCTPFEPFDPRGFSFDAPGLCPAARKSRDTLAKALTAAGLTNYPGEYWHWSYGDQGWAYRGGHPNALYGPITPPNWSPTAEELGRDPLRFLEE